LYGLDFLMSAMADPTGLTMPVAIEEMFWATQVLVWQSWVQVLQLQEFLATEHLNK